MSNPYAAQHAAAAEAKRAFYAQRARDEPTHTAPVLRYAVLLLQDKRLYRAYTTARDAAKRRAFMTPEDKSAHALCYGKDRTAQSRSEGEAAVRPLYRQDPAYVAAHGAIGAHRAAMKKFQTMSAFGEVAVARAAIRRPSAPIVLSYTFEGCQRMLYWDEGDACHCAHCPGTFWLESYEKTSGCCGAYDEDSPTIVPFLKCTFCAYAHHWHGP